MKMENLDYCEIMKSKSFLYGRIFSSLEANTNGVVSKCPILPGVIRISNMTDDATKHDFMPVGDYILSLKIYDSADDNIFKLSLYYSLKSRTGTTM